METKVVGFGTLSALVMRWMVLICGCIGVWALSFASIFPALPWWFF